MDKRIVGVYNSGDEAVTAIEDLKSQGYDRDAISVIAKDKHDVADIHEETGTKTEEGMATGAATGGVLGGLAGFLAGVGALAIPGVGPILAAGPIAATLTGAAVGAGAGGLAGALIGMGIPEDEANRYESDVKSGKILVLVDEDRDGLGTGNMGTGAVTGNTNDWSGSTTMNNSTGRTGNEFGSGTVDGNYDTLGGNLNTRGNVSNSDTFRNETGSSVSGMMTGGASVGGSRTSNTTGAAFGTDEESVMGGPGGNSVSGRNDSYEGDIGYNAGLGTDPNLANTPNATPESSMGDSLISNDPFRGTDDTLREPTRNRDGFGNPFDKKDNN